MFVFPVEYTHTEGAESHLCSYIPVLYLDSFIGVTGGLYYGLRKEYHPEMVVNETDSHKDWSIANIIDASFDKVSDISEFPQFYSQSFQNPFVTISYLDDKTWFYQAKVNTTLNKSASEDFEWHYKEKADIKSSDDTSSIYSEYTFTMSQPMNYKTYFGSNQITDSI